MHIRPTLDVYFKPLFFLLMQNFEPPISKWFIPSIYGEFVDGLLLFFNFCFNHISTAKDDFFVDQRKIGRDLVI